MIYSGPEGDRLEPSNPFAAAGEPTTAGNSALAALRAAAPVAVPVTLVVAAIEGAGISAVGGLPPIPIGVGIAAVLVEAVVVGLVLAGWARRAALLPAVLGWPLLLFAVDLGEQSTEVLDQQFDQLAFSMLWGTIGWALIAAAWLRVPPTRLPAYVGVVAIKGQGIRLGMQFVFPGLALALAMQLLEVAAARADDRQSWVVEAFREMTRCPSAWVVAFAGTVGGWALSTAAMAVVLGPERFMEAFLDPGAATLPSNLAASVVNALVAGPCLCVAAALVRPAAPPAV
jgi:hypothetical protein